MKVNGGRRDRLNPVLSLEDSYNDEKPLALTNGGVHDDMNDSQPMNAVLPPPGDHYNREKPQTAKTKVRPYKQRQHNSLNLHAPASHGSQTRLKQANTQNQNILLGRIEQNKYMTEKDAELEALKADEGKR